jgi:hypothetical protein
MLYHIYISGMWIKEKMKIGYLCYRSDIYLEMLQICDFEEKEAEVHIQASI